MKPPLQPIINNRSISPLRFFPKENSESRNQNISYNSALSRNNPKLNNNNSSLDFNDVQTQVDTTFDSVQRDRSPLIIRRTISRNLNKRAKSTTKKVDLSGSATSELIELKTKMQTLESLMQTRPPQNETTSQTRR